MAGQPGEFSGRVLEFCSPFEDIFFYDNIDIDRDKLKSNREEMELADLMLTLTDEDQGRGVRLCLRRRKSIV
eukprot:scaffold1200_cov109-Skeletonema_marinoi.AAC.1